ncbi:MAG: hypothetical protein HUJ60_00915, partial [Bacilli bacterium]|nr:hypothetical protein [Bacilli bacterium]
DPWGGGGGQNVQYNEDDNDVTGTKYRFEAEAATPSSTGVTMDKSGNGSSNNGYVGSFAAGATLTFNVNAPSATEAYVYLGVAAREYARIASWFTVTVNGTAINPTADKYVPANSNDPWHAWMSMPYGKTALKAGANAIVLTVAMDNATNLDYIEIQCPVALTA